jgi:hypothetical protein
VENVYITVYIGNEEVYNSNYRIALYASTTSVMWRNNKRYLLPLIDSNWWWKDFKLPRCNTVILNLDMVIANPPFGKNGKKKEDGLQPSSKNTSYKTKRYK